MRRRAIALLPALLLAACGRGGGHEVVERSTGPTADVGCGAEADLGRVVVLGEEFLLADVLALGVEPVAATATLGTGFVGIERDTGGIEPLDQLQLNAEQLAALRPDTIVTTEFIAEQADADVLGAVADEVVVIPDDPDWRSQLRSLAGALGGGACADPLLDAYAEAVDAAGRAIPDDLRVSMATVYPGENLAVWVGGPANIPATFADAGVELVPGADAVDDVQGGRAFLSTERLGELTGVPLVLLQSSAVDGEDAALDVLRSSPLWARLPAVAADRVLEVDRLGYPGVEGRTRLARELPALLGAGDEPVTSGSDTPAGAAEAGGAAGRADVASRAPEPGAGPVSTSPRGPSPGARNPDGGGLAAALGPAAPGTYTYEVTTDAGVERRTTEVADLGGGRQRHTDRYADGTVDGREVSNRADGLFIERVEPPGFACDVEPDLPQLRFPLAARASWSATADCDTLVAEVDLEYSATVRGTAAIDIAGEVRQTWVVDSVLVTTTRVPAQERTYRTLRTDHFDPATGLPVRTEYDNDGRKRSEQLTSRRPR